MTGRLIRVRGQVQGVGFRPFVWQLAQRFGLTGEVLNDPEGVLIRAFGPDLDGFMQALRAEAPPLARVDALEAFPLDTLAPEAFTIAASQGTGAETRVTPDAATCPDCLAEIRDAGERRHGYAFANCTHCGPRFTILQGLPYDRAQTTMAPFEMCAACQAEYDNPADRRFHAQPVACAACGPKVWLEADGAETEAWLPEAARRLQAGEILAIKGLGGFHLAVNALDADAVALLRTRKRRPSKPLALMARMEDLRRYAQVTDAAEALLRDPAAPIVLLDKGPEPLPQDLAPGMTQLGWMLPYTPLHHLLMDALQGPLVMTSGNLSGEPQVITNAEAREKLTAFADAFVMHNRDIARRLDDSVERAAPPMVLRRARGRVPGTLPLPPGFADTQVVAYGGQMKGAICLVKNGQALLGHHLGELDEPLTWDAFLNADRDYAALFDHAPSAVAVDLHPDFRPSRHGAERAEREGLHLTQVQHHHAHLASCLAENLWPLDGGKVAGIILDGTGLGADNTVWGGEVLLGDYHGFERKAWLAPAPLVGGDMAAKEPWRNALVRLDQAGCEDRADSLFPDQPRAMLRMAAAKGLNAPACSSVGRLFDAVAALLLTLQGPQSYEGEAAMQLEALATRSPQSEALGKTWSDTAGFGTRPAIGTDALFYNIADGLARGGHTPGQMAFAFHQWVASHFAAKARALVTSGQAQAVALSGGCFQNALLLELTTKALGDVPVLTHRTTPAGDGGLALGQAVIAAAQHQAHR
ncbi:carbamoyltransferase HypF [Tropicibacter naphthalenivorans]|uniref:Carbamoyltransferase HypF n=1 Tax=Tropicibacter naphthalenivorans TaxID=441103 RepID=A0A0P1G2B4_9RHOB|nr:carbamoyltransferase HypF [Tropicibacter naphthalenivorans]CUH75932.1 Carbamoyltransferase HypF [Tropicibacter naphthalenivorans]SMC41202.1 Hydrogenase maturation protein, carbamoyltransferase HypF [Tropicibacter naphthalenivorans]